MSKNKSPRLIDALYEILKTPDTKSWATLDPKIKAKICDIMYEVELRYIPRKNFTPPSSRKVGDNDTGVDKSDK